MGNTVDKHSPAAISREACTTTTCAVVFANYKVVGQILFRATSSYNDCTNPPGESWQLLLLFPSSSSSKANSFPSAPNVRHSTNAMARCSISRDGNDTTTGWELPPLLSDGGGDGRCCCCLLCRRRRRRQGGNHSHDTFIVSVFTLFHLLHRCEHRQSSQSTR